MIKPSSLIPRTNAMQTMLASVIAIMTFVSAVIITLLGWLNQGANNWHYQLQREAMVQIKPDIADIAQHKQLESKLQQAKKLIERFDFVTNVHIISQKETENLLSPWLGDDLNSLALPRVIIIQFANNKDINMAALKNALSTIKGAEFYNHQSWIQHVAHIKDLAKLFAIIILLLLAITLVLTIAFAVKAVIASNKEIIKLLSFIGADHKFIAKEFGRVFLQSASQGASLGAAFALFVFIVITLISRHWQESWAIYQFLSLFGAAAPSFSHLITLAIVMLFMIILTQLTSQYSLMAQLKTLERSEMLF